jgi:hypothetical protein
MWGSFLVKKTTVKILQCGFYWPTIFKDTCAFYKTCEKYQNEYDTIQARSNSNFDVKCATIQFYSNNHNSQSDRCIELKFYVESPDMFSYLGLTFQVNQSSGRHRNTGQQRLHEFCYLLPFDLWTSYLARILFPKRM